MSPQDKNTGGSSLHAALRNSFVLGVFALMTVGLVATTWLVTKDHITEQVRLSEQKALFEVLHVDYFDNNLLDTTVVLPEPARLGPITGNAKAWVAFRNQQPSAVILPTVAPDGYNGRIQLLVGITREGVLTGVRVVTHKETPGLGDKIESRVSSWIENFNGKSLLAPEEHGWALKKDGGEFDQFTGATVTPRAIVSAIYRTLLYFNDYQQQIFDTATSQWQQQSAQQQPTQQHTSAEGGQ